LRKTILFRAEASREIGLGHLIRSISIANKIRKEYTDVNIKFLSGNFDISINIIKENGFEVFFQEAQSEEDFIINAIINSNAHTLFIDKLYNYSANFIIKLKELVKVVMFHNYCDGANFTNAYIFPSAHTDPLLISDLRWSNNITNLYYGFDYVVLNEKIVNIKKERNYKKKSATIVITTGGSDPKGVLIKVLRWINQIDILGVNVLALVGESFVHTKTLESLKKKLNKNIIVTPYDVSYLEVADMAISTFGVSTYELVYLGLPILSIGHCKKNAESSRILSEKCSQLIDLGNIDDLTKEKFRQGLYQVMDRIKTNQVSGCLIDGKGVSRVAEIIYNIEKEA